MLRPVPHDGFLHCHVSRELILLFQVPDAQAPTGDNLARIWDQVTGDQPQKSRLTVAVSPDDPDPVPFCDPQSEPLEHFAGGVLQMQVLDAK